jgi:hypothetical protein
MSVAPNAGVVDLDNFLPPTAGTDGVQGQVPKPLAGQQDYVLTANGWLPLSALGTLVFQGTWDASTNTPTLASGVGTAGYYYVVSVAGNTDLNGITTWTVGDWALFNGSVWQKIEGGSTVDITGGTINNTVIGNTTPNAATFTTLTATGQTDLGGTASTKAVRIETQTSTGQHILFSRFDAGNTQKITAAGIANMALQSTGGGFISLRTADGSEEQARITRTASAVNYVQVTGAATNNRPTASSQGSDTDIGFNIVTKGSGTHNFASDANIGTSQFQVTRTQASAVNYLTATGAATNFSPRLFAAGSDTNIAQVFQSKGTGAINLAPGSSGVNISNGGTVTAITRTAGGSGYTSAPSVAISAPTTAGGVQATASASIWLAGITSIANGGTGYSVNDVLTVSGGTFTTAATVTVLTTSGGVVTSVGVNTNGQYSVAPTNPASFTGGTGAGLTVNLLFNFAATGFTITNAGSGYVEQPTVTFSGGGGSGAAAYATVGATTTFRTIGHTGTVAMRFDVPSSLPNNIPTLRLIDSGNAQDSGVQVLGGIGGSVMNAFGATNATLALHAAGTGFVRLGSGGTSQTEQLRVTHTASAVNFVQVTGAATGGGIATSPTIGSQGSDTNVSLNLNGKGNGGVRISAQRTNFVTISGSGSGGGFVLLAADGGDTNIAAVVQPKGTGALQAQLNDGTATGGNARGANAVDWQTNRFAATQVASGQYSAVLGGNNNTASGFGTSVAGSGNTASGTLSYVGGGVSNTSGNYAGIAYGFSNTSSGFFNFIGGGASNSTTTGSAVTTQSGTMNATTAVTLSGSNASIKVGQLVQGTSITFPTYVAAISGTSLTLSQAASGSSTSTLSFFTPHGVVVGGGNNQATGAYSFIGGGGDAGTAANRNVASGDWSTVAGGRRNTASGQGSFVGGGGYEGSSVAPNTASGGGSCVLGGVNNIASGYLSSVVGGNLNAANSAYGSVLGGAAGNTRGAHGYTVLSSTVAIAFASGVSQTALIVLARQTTDATATVITSDGNAASTTNQVILPNNAAYFFRGEVVSGVTGGGNTKGWTIEGVIKRGANAASTALVGTPTVTSMYADVGAATWTIAVTADTTNGGLAVTFTGQAGTTIRTVARINTVEMTF